MRPYAGYAYYESHGSGRVAKEQYNYYALQARAQIDYLTRDRISALAETPEQVKLCACELVDLLYARNVALGQVEGQQAPVKSETVDNYKVEYATITAAAVSSGSVGETDAGVYAVCRKWLTRPTNFMYAGVN